MSIIKVMPLSKQNKAYYSQAKKNIYDENILNKKLNVFNLKTKFKADSFNCSLEEWPQLIDSYV